MCEALILDADRLEHGTRRAARIASGSGECCVERRGDVGFTWARLRSSSS
jgi:hypothetical protein